jgi:hypothetical protein
MKDYRYRAQTRNGITGAVLVGLLAVFVVVGPHLLRASPTTNESTDPNNGVRTTARVRSVPRCHIGAPVWMSLRGYLHLAAASVCPASPGPGNSSSRSAFPLSPPQLRELEADFNAHSTSSPRIRPSCGTKRRSTVLSGLTVDGHQVQLYADACTGEFAGVGRYWVPSAATRATIRAVMGQRAQRRP